MIDVVALGELLIDFASRSADPNGYPTMQALPGGAPANFLAALTKYGKCTAFLGKVGDDAFGHLLVGTVKDTQQVGGKNNEKTVRIAPGAGHGHVPGRLWRWPRLLLPQKSPLRKTQLLHPKHPQQRPASKPAQPSVSPCYLRSGR